MLALLFSTSCVTKYHGLKKSRRQYEMNEFIETAKTKNYEYEFWFVKIYDREWDMK